MNNKTDFRTMLREEEDLPKNLGKGVMIAFGILLFHMLLLLGICLLVFFLKGLINYASMLLLAGFLLLGLLFYLSFRRFKKNRSRLEDILTNPDFADKDLEIRLLGGLASLRRGQGKDATRNLPPREPLMLESSQGSRIRDLTELGGMYEKNLLTREEYELAKEEIFRNFKRDQGPPLLVEVGNPEKTPEVQ